MSNRNQAPVFENRARLGPDVSIVGELNPDMIAYGLPWDLPAEREILASGFQLTLGSSSAILAHNLSLLGTRVQFNSLVGEDMFGEFCCRKLAEAQVDLRGVARTGTVGTGVTIILAHDRERRILTYPGAMDELCLEDLDLDRIATARHFHLSSLYLHRRLFAHVPWLFTEMKRRGLTTSLDTNDDPAGEWKGLVDEILPHVDLFFCNADEMSRIAKCENAAQYLAARVPLLVVKHGRQGASAYIDNQTHHAPALEVEVADSVGAGDTFAAGFLHRWLQGAPVDECLRFANVAGGLSVTRPGGTEAFRDPEHRKNFFAFHWDRAQSVR